MITLGQASARHGSSRSGRNAKNILSVHQTWRRLKKSKGKRSMILFALEGFKPRETYGPGGGRSVWHLIVRETDCNSPGDGLR